MRRLSRITLAALGALAASITGCAGEDPDRGLDEPLRVTGGTFKPGDLPGEPPLPKDAPPETPRAEPRVTLIESVNNVISPGQAAKTLSGRTDEEAVALGIRFKDLGTGYWVLPTGSLDPAVPGERVWSLSMEVDEAAPPGLHELLLVAQDEAGTAGTQSAITVCVVPEIPDNLNACDPTIEPPFAVLSLEWDNAADLDLGVFTPKGKLVDSKHPTTATPAPDAQPGDPLKPDLAKDGAIDQDANAACSGGLRRRENLVWQSKPRTGVYAVYVNLFEACGEQAARFTVTLHLRESTGEGTFTLAEKLRIPGQLLAGQANGGTAPGLYLTSFEIK
jgi:hypothetical protein